MSINSTNVKIFPWARSTGTGVLMYEDNIANLVRQITDNNFIIEGTITNGSITSDCLKLNINGYYIELKSTQTVGENAFVSISVDSSSDIPELNGQSGENTPIDIYNADDDEIVSLRNNKCYLQITDRAGNLYENSRMKFNATSFIDIDGQHPIYVSGS